MTAAYVDRRPALGGGARGRQICQGGSEQRAGEGRQPRPLTPLQRLNLAMCQDEKTIRELAVGRRLGLYKVRGEIGRGSFSSVKLGIHALTTDKVAIKVLEKSRLDENAQRLLCQEVASMERLHHPNVIRLYEVLETPSRLHLVMEYAEGGELYARISAKGKLPDAEAKLVFAQIVSAVKHMHESDIVHRDLKAENVFYTRGGCVKVGDFGFSAACGRAQTLSTFCGSAPYAAPELFRDGSYAGAPVDAWALGVLLFFAVTGAMPFRADTVPRLKRRILRGAYAVPPGVPAPCRRLIAAILRPLPAERCTAEQMGGSEWLLPVALPPPIGRFRLDPAFLAEAGPGELDEDELEARAALEELGITAEHVRNNRDKCRRGGLAGVYRILLHRAHKRRGLEAPPTLRLPVADPRGDWIRAYWHLHHTSKLCTIA
ncbi:serine/threonine-protein kinase NIM1-like [Anguilla anguilla]|uniref:serine/threonine-protein kinase NIM1-like n=1 Tax=Anguilla anguilla TaxID=7936 RepID=UPI0015B21317|nr:serine/threonine-protein kinase NIM1-like [Anguilla anguilla]